MTAPLTLAEFQAHAAAALGIESSALAADADLRDAIGLDSIQMFLLLVAAEDLGVMFPEQLLPQIRTLADAHHYYLQHLGHHS
ncbi:MAG: acyl carrier protein [Actinomycetota bacterium]